jgi:hypothetical protein
MSCCIIVRNVKEQATMAGMTRQETAKLINRYIGVSGGYLGDFSYRTHKDFYAEYCDLYFDTYSMPGTTRDRFEQILIDASPVDQAKIIRGTLAKYAPDPEATQGRTKQLHDELLGVAIRLEGIMSGRISQADDHQCGRRTGDCRR